MAIFRKKLKEKLIEKQHKRYEKELSGKKITYEKWIEEQEKILGNDENLRIKLENNLINESENRIIDGENGENEGNASDCRKTEGIYSIID